MGHYRVTIADDANSALDYLKELPAAVRRELFAVMRTELRATPLPGDPDDARLDDKWLLRRGITRAHRQALAARPRESAPELRGWDFVIVYRQFNATEYWEVGGRDGFYVWHIWSNAVLAKVLLRQPFSFVRLPAPTRR